MGPGFCWSRNGGNVGDIIHPSEFSNVRFDPKANVTRFEFQAVVKQMEASVNEIAQQLHLVSIKLEAMVKASMHCPDRIWEKTDTGMKLKVGEYFRYFNKMLMAYVPVNEAVMESPSIMERCLKAAQWNAGSPEMPLMADDLNLAEIVLRRGGSMPTPEEEEAIAGLPKTDLWDEHWRAVKAQREQLDQRS